MSDDDPLLSLIDGYCSGSLSDDGFSKLEAALRKDPALRQELIKSRILDADLRSVASSDRRTVDTSMPPSSRHASRRLPLELAALVALLLLLALGISLFLWPGNREADMARAEPGVDQGVAVLTQALAARWEGSPIRPGDSLIPGRWRLAEGKAEIEFYSGASIILEAPADLEIESENGGILHRGKLRAHVPLHAQGFTVTTKAIRLVDLGTSFGIEVDSDESAAVHVFDGKVELFDPTSTNSTGSGQEILAGEGRMVDLTGHMEAIEADASRFLDASDLQAEVSARFAIWQRASAATLRDKRLLAAYPFEPDHDSTRTLLNVCPNAEETLRGAIIGARWSKGRWRDKGALDFKRPGDRVRVSIPCSQTSVTLIAWVRIDGFDNSFHSILLSDGWDRPGALHWQIHRDGYVELAVWCDQKSRHNNSRAPFLMEASDFGRWVQLAVVYDGDAGTVTHFRDGAPAESTSLMRIVPIAIGQ
ncbi:MAG: LamG-like jellyroll fold domain-containing protein, partial [Verrucomicrobiota bacterium]